MTKCQICENSDAIIDGKTIYGSWAYMCKICHNTHGVGIGLGRGQLLSVVPGRLER